MNRARLLFVMGFLLAMCAGVVVGMVVGRAPKAETTPAPTSRPSLEADLKLDPQQSEQVHAIWSGVWSSVRQMDSNRTDKRRALSRERDEAITQLIPAERKAEYDRIMQDYTSKVAELSKDRDKIFQDAEQKMKPLLTETQWKRYEEIKKERMDRGHGGRPPGGRGGPHPSSNRSGPPGEPHDREPRPSEG